MMRRAFALAAALVPYSLCLAQAPVLHVRAASGAFDMQAEQADVRLAISRLMFHGRKRVVFSPGVRGIVTLYMRGLDLDTILSSATRQVHATYRVDSNGTYHVFPRPDDSLPAWLVPYAREPEAETSFEPVGDPRDIRNVIGAFFAARKMSVVIDPKIRGIVDLQLPNGIAFESGLDLILRAAGATYWVESGRFHIAPRNVPPAESKA
jgi:type II secretory pathway component GspD/PulD (secretin)